MTYDDLKTALTVWLGEFALWRGADEMFRFHDTDDPQRGFVTMCTATSSYRLSFIAHEDGSTYLGCIVSNRIVRAGETWTRGSDLPDGEFGRHTFDRIIKSILALEFVTLEPEQRSMADEPVEVRVTDAEEA